jgi:hypothetical protein
MLEDHTNASAAAGGFDRPDAVLERKTARLDERGWKALTAEVQKLLDRVARIEADAAKRLDRAGGEGAMEAGVVALAFESVLLSDQIPASTKKRTPMRRSRRG